MKKLYQILQNREYLFITVLGILPLLEKNTIIKLFKEKKDYQNYILGNPSTSFSLDIVTGLVLLLMIFQLHFRWKNKVIVDNIRVLLLIVLCFWYSVARFSLQWKFSPTYNFQTLYYTDLLIVITYFNCILLIKNYFDAYILMKFKPLLAITKNQEGFILESNGDQDILGRKSYAKNISNTILKSRIDKQESCAIGITSSWGSGKSFFLDEIKKNLKNNDCIIIDFNPWKNHTSKNLINNFFDTFNDALSEYNPKLSSQIRQYANQLAEAEDNSYTKALDFLFQLVYGKKSIDELYDTINSTINKIDKKIIVFIDDLDRLDGNEILEIFKLVRASSNFENTVFVVAFDKEYILSVLSSQSTDFRANFLEKIFIAEFCLPDFESEIIYEEFERRLKECIDERYHVHIEDYFRTQISYQEYILKKCILSIRDVIRFPNVFKVNFNQISDQVWFHDFLNLELIRYKYPPIYNFIRKNLKRFQESDKMFLFKINQLELKSLWGKESSLNNYTSEIVTELFTAHINKVKDNKTTLPAKIDTSLNEKTSLSIRCYSNCHTYFTLRLIDKALDDYEFRNFRKRETISFLEKIEEWSQLSDKTFDDLTLKMFAVSELTSQLEYINILRGLYYIIQKFQDYQYVIFDDQLEKEVEAYSCFNKHFENFLKNLTVSEKDVREVLIPDSRYSALISLKIINYMLERSVFVIDSVKTPFIIDIFTEALSDALIDTISEYGIDWEPFIEVLQIIKNNSDNFITEKVSVVIDEFLSERKEHFLVLILHYYNQSTSKVSLETQRLYDIGLNSNEKVKLFFNKFPEPLSKELYDLYEMEEFDFDSPINFSFSDEAEIQLRSIFHGVNPYFPAVYDF